MPLEIEGDGLLAGKRVITIELLLKRMPRLRKILDRLCQTLIPAGLLLSPRIGSLDSLIL